MHTLSSSPGAMNAVARCRQLAPTPCRKIHWNVSRLCAVCRLTISAEISLNADLRCNGLMSFAAALNRHYFTVQSPSGRIHRFCRQPTPFDGLSRSWKKLIGGTRGSLPSNRRKDCGLERLTRHLHAGLLPLIRTLPKQRSRTRCARSRQGANLVGRVSVRNQGYGLLRFVWAHLTLLSFLSFGI